MSRARSSSNADASERSASERAAANGQRGRGTQQLDQHDKAIIRELQVDGRMPYSQLAPKTGLSEAATRQRVNRLLERGVMQVVAVTDPFALGLSYQAMVGITVDGDVNAVAEAIGELDEVVYVVVVGGRFDILAEVVCTDPEHLLAVVNDGIRPVEGVRTTEMMTYLRIVSETYNWGTG